MEEDIKLCFAKAIAEKLIGAPDGDAKSELLEELADNLYQRYLELTAAGEDPEAAFDRAMEDLGDVGELAEYLRSQAGEDGAAQPGDSIGDLVRDVEQLVRSALGTAFKAVRETRDLWSAGGRHAQDGAVREEQTIPGQGLLGLDVQFPQGDISLRCGPEEDVYLAGDLSEMSVTVDGGVLTVLPVRPGAGGRSWPGGPRLEIRIPARDWDSLRLFTANGDINLDCALRAEHVAVMTANGDVDGQMPYGRDLGIKTANGDLHWQGSGEQVSLRTASGDIFFEGSAVTLSAASASGDVEIAGQGEEIQCSSFSGDVRLETDRQPRSLSVRSKSGDCRLRLPEGPEGFSVAMRTVSGDVDSEFPLWKAGKETRAVSGEGGPEYTVATVSGDIELKKY